jgi:hypothetical protein
MVIKSMTWVFVSLFNNEKRQSEQDLKNAVNDALVFE